MLNNRVVPSSLAAADSSATSARGVSPARAAQRYVPQTNAYQRTNLVTRFLLFCRCVSVDVTEPSAPAAGSSVTDQPAGTSGIYVRPLGPAAGISGR